MTAVKRRGSDLRVGVRPGIRGHGIDFSITHGSICFAIECMFDSFEILTAMSCKLDHRSESIVCKVLECC